MSGRSDVVPREPVVGKDLPGGDRADERVRLGSAVVVETEGRKPHAGRLGVRPSAAEEVRAAHRTERLRRSTLGRVRGEKVGAFEQVYRVRVRATAHRSVSARDPLAVLAVAKSGTEERLGHLEANASAEAGSDERVAQYAASSQLSSRSRRSRRNIPAYAPSTSRWS